MIRRIDPDAFGECLHFAERCQEEGLLGGLVLGAVALAVVRVPSSAATAKPLPGLPHYTAGWQMIEWTRSSARAFHGAGPGPDLHVVHMRTRIRDYVFTKLPSR